MTLISLSVPVLVKGTLFELVQTYYSPSDISLPTTCIFYISAMNDFSLVLFLLKIFGQKTINDVDQSEVNLVGTFKSPLNVLMFSDHLIVVCY